MDAVIYAAGRALRLGPKAIELPKILLEFGGRSLLERHALLLAQAGVKHLHVVTGHCRAMIADILPQLSASAGIPVTEVFNPDFTEGSVLSVRVSLPVLRKSEGPMLLMDGDVLYDQRLLRPLIESKHETVLLVDRNYSTADDDPVLVPVKGGRPFEFRKKWQGEADWAGESIDFFKVAPEDLRRLEEDVERRCAAGGRGDSYDEVLRALVRQDRFGLEDVSGQPWTEVDFEDDIEYGRSVILPRLEPLVGPAPVPVGKARHSAKSVGPTGDRVVTKRG
jgi:choline kinase